MSKILNDFFCTVAIFLLSFAWIYYCLKNATYALVLGAIVAVCSCYLVFRAQQRTPKRNKVDKNRLQRLANTLRYNADNGALFSKMLSFYHYQTIKKDYDYLVAQRNDEKAYVALMYDKDKLCLSDVITCVVNAKRNDCTRLIVFCQSCDGALTTQANAQTPTSVVDLSNAYALLDNAQRLPPLQQKDTAKQNTFASVTFNKSKAKWFFTSSLFTLVTSVFSFFPWYLLGWSTLLLAMGIYSLLNTKYNKKSTNVTL